MHNDLTVSTHSVYKVVCSDINLQAITVIQIVQSPSHAKFWWYVVWKRSSATVFLHIACTNSERTSSAAQQV